MYNLLIDSIIPGTEPHTIHPSDVTNVINVSWNYTNVIYFIAINFHLKSATKDLRKIHINRITYSYTYFSYIYQ